MNNVADGGRHLLPDEPLPGSWVKATEGDYMTWSGKVSWKVGYPDCVVSYLLGRPRELQGECQISQDIISSETASGARSRAIYVTQRGRWFPGGMSYTGDNLSFVRCWNADTRTWDYAAVSVRENQVFLDRVMFDRAVRFEGSVMLTRLRDSREVREFCLDDARAKELYAAFCNAEWADSASGDVLSISWRSSGGVVADLRPFGEDYMDFYCSGGEGDITERVRALLGGMGWLPLDM